MHVDIMPIALAIGIKTNNVLILESKVTVLRFWIVNIHVHILFTCHVKYFHKGGPHTIVTSEMAPPPPKPTNQADLQIQ